MFSSNSAIIPLGEARVEDGGPLLLLEAQINRVVRFANPFDDWGVNVPLNTVTEDEWKECVETLRFDWALRMEHGECAPYGLIDIPVGIVKREFPASRVKGKVKIKYGKSVLMLGAIYQIWKRKTVEGDY